MTNDFWEMVKLIANARHYLKTNERLPIFVLDKAREMNIEIIQSKNCEINLVMSEVSDWMDFLKENRSKTICFEAENSYQVDYLYHGRPNPDCKIVLRFDWNAVAKWGQYPDANKTYYKVDSYRLGQNFYPYQTNTIFELKTIVQQNCSIAKKNDWESFTIIFDKILKALQSRERIKEQRRFIALPSTYHEDAEFYLAILQYLSQVFGGMGNWDDGGVPTELTDELYKQFIQGVLYCVNAGDEPGFSLEG